MKNMINFKRNAVKSEKDSENMKKSFCESLKKYEAIFSFLKNSSGKNDKKPDERNELLNSLKETKNKLNNIYSLFNMTDDEDLIESYIHEINSLNSRYSYLLNQIKNMEKVGENL